MRAPFWVGFVLGLLVGAGLVLAIPSLGEWLAFWRAFMGEIHPAVAIQPSTLRLTNTDSFEWTNVELRLNATAADERYTFHLAHLPAGGQVDLTLTSFTTATGQSFNPRTTKAFLLSLRAKTPQGAGHRVQARRLRSSPIFGIDLGSPKVPMTQEVVAMFARATMTGIFRHIGK